MAFNVSLIFMLNCIGNLGYDLLKCREILLNFPQKSRDLVIVPEQFQNFVNVFLLHAFTFR